MWRARDARIFNVSPHGACGMRDELGDVLIDSVMLHPGYTVVNPIGMIGEGGA